METSHLNREGKGNPEICCGNVLLQIRQIITYNWMSTVLTEKYNKQETKGKLIELSAEREKEV